MNENIHHDVAIQGVMALDGKKFEIKTVLLKMVPVIVQLLTELIITGKINTSGKDSGVIQGVISLLHALLDELEG